MQHRSSCWGSPTDPAMNYKTSTLQVEHSNTFKKLYEFNNKSRELCAEYEHMASDIPYQHDCECSIFFHRILILIIMNIGQNWVQTHDQRRRQSNEVFLVRSSRVATGYEQGRQMLQVQKSCSFMYADIRSTYRILPKCIVTLSKNLSVQNQ